MAFRGTLTVLSADNLAAWNIGGFKALASAFRKCQYCMVVDEDMQTKVLIYLLCKLHVVAVVSLCVIHSMTVIVMRSNISWILPIV